MSPLTVIGICTYHAAVQRWLRTLRAHYDGPCQLYLVNSAPFVLDVLARRYDCEVIDVPAAPDYWTAPPPGRFCKVWSCLADACLNRVRTPFVLRTDVWDVVFQSDPRLHMQPRPERILIVSEHVRLSTDAQILRWVGPWAAHLPSGQVYNGGMVCGPTAGVAALGRVIGGCPFTTEVDQAELVVFANTFPNGFDYRPGFMECISGGLSATGEIRDNRFVDRLSGKPWCVVHGNGSTKSSLDTYYPLQPSDHTLG